MFWESVKTIEWANICQREGNKHMKHIRVTGDRQAKARQGIWLLVTDEYVNHKSYIEISYNDLSKTIKFTHLAISFHPDNPEYTKEISRMVNACFERMKEELFAQSATRLYMVTEGIQLKKP